MVASVLLLAFRAGKIENLEHLVLGIHIVWRVPPNMNVGILHPKEGRASQCPQRQKVGRLLKEQAVDDRHHKTQPEPISSAISKAPSTPALCAQLGTWVPMSLLLLELPSLEAA